MRLTSFFVVSLLLTLVVAACDSPAGPGRGCDVVPTRVVSTSGDTVQTVSGLRYLDFEVGTGTEVRTCVQVEVTYAGYLEDGTRFDAGTILVIPGGRMVIPGFEQALMGMRVGGTRRAIIPPYLGYGAGGAPPRIPPNATLIFDLEIRSVTE